MIDPTQPVTLKKHALVRGNFYHPREYNPGELPSELLVEEYVLQNPPEVPTFSPFAGAFEETNIKIGIETPTSEQTSYGTTVIVPPVTPERIQINNATIEAIAALDGISLPVAKKVVEERVKTPFANLDDLKTRVPLAKNLKWESFSDKLLFDQPVVEQNQNEDPTSGTVQ